MKAHPLPARLLASPLRVFFHLLYHQMAFTYDLVAAVVSLGRWKDWVLSIAPDLSGPMVLELGHGPGHLQSALRQGGANCFGLDRSRQMSRMAAQRLRREGIEPWLVNGESQALPFPANTFDQIAATFPSEYIADPQTLGEVFRVLAPDGKLIAVLIAWITGERWFERVAAWLFRITGQAGEWNERILRPFRQAGFQAMDERRVVRSSTLLIVQATKPPNR